MSESSCEAFTSADLQLVAPISERSAWTLRSGNGDVEYRLLIANDLETRRRAYQLGYHVYAQNKMPPLSHVPGLYVTPYDKNPNTITLLVEDSRGRDIATVTSVFDSAAGLPCDQIFLDEINSLRLAGARLVEVSRLALSPDCAHAKLVLNSLFMFNYVAARHVRDCTDSIIEVVQRHAEFYRRMLGYEVIGSPREWKRADGVIATLLRLTLEIPEREAASVRQRGRASSRHSLYECICSRDEELAIADFISNEHRPMTDAESVYFGLA